MAEPDKDKQAQEQEETKFTKIDPSTLAPELQELYKSMQADYTRKTQELAKMRDEFTEKQTSWEQQNAEKFQKLGQLEQEIQQWRAWAASLGSDQGADNPNSATGVDYEAEEGTDAAARKLEQEIRALHEKIQALETTTMRSNEEVGRMFKYQDALNELKAEHPDVDKDQIIEYMLKEGVTDPRRAYKELYQDQIIEQEAKKRFEQMKAEFEEKQKADVLTGAGTAESTIWKPSTVNPQQGKPKSWDEVHDEVLMEHKKQELGLT